MAERGGRFPIGWVIVGPPALALGYYLVLWLIYGVLGWTGSWAPLAPIFWFYFHVFVPLAEKTGVDMEKYSQAVQDGILCLAWTAAFLLLGLVLAGLVALGGLVVPRGDRGRSDDGGER